MRNMILLVSFLALMLGVTSCKNEENTFLNDAIKHHSPDVQKVELVGNSVVYTHIFDGIIDVKTYTYDGDSCIEAERVYVFPNQMSALRHYRRAVEQAELYDDIQIFKNEVRYDLKEAQHKLETAGLTKEQLKAKFDKQIADVNADIKKAGNNIEKDLKCCDNEKVRK